MANKKTTTDSNSVITPTNPSQVTNGLTGFANNITNLQNQDPYSFTAGANPLETQAGAAAGGLGAGVGNANIATNLANAYAMNTTGGVMTANAPQMQSQSLLDNLQSYMSPYTNDVVNSTLGNYDRTASQNRAQQMLSIGGMDDTFGGSGAMSYLGNYDAANQLNRAQTEAQLRDQGFTTGAGLSNQDAERRQSASATNAQLSSDNLTRQLAAAAQESNQAQLGLTNALGVDANSRSNIATQGSTGEALRQIQLQHQLAPLSTAATIGGLWGSAPFSLLHGEDQTSHSTQTTSDPMGTLGGLLGGVGSLGVGLGALGLGPAIGSVFGAGASAGGLGSVMGTPLSLSGISMPSRFGG